MVAHLEDLIARGREALSARKEELLVCAFQSYVDSDPQELYAALEKKLGSAAMGNRVYHDPLWIRDVSFPGGKIQISDQNGRLNQINVWFDSPVPLDDALMMFGFPTGQLPTKQGPQFFVWLQTFDVDRLHFWRVRGTTNEVSQLTVVFRC